MEKVPQGTFEEELEWCIRQLENGLVRLNPTAIQVSDTQRVLQVLRSRKATFVKKRQMMNQFFGNYREKMAEERKTQEKAAISPVDVHIQEGIARDIQSVAYRKCSKDASGSSSQWFTTSRNRLCPDGMVQVEEGGSGDAEKNHGEIIIEGDDSVVQEGNNISTCTGSGFTFNFQIKEEEGSSAQSYEDQGKASGEHSTDGLSTQVVKDALVEQKGSLESLGDSTGAKPTVAFLTTIKIANQDMSGTMSGDSPRKKKKKKGSQVKSPAGTVPSEKKEVTREGAVGKSTPRDVQQTGADELMRELDWCVEQLKLGLQRQKSTPKQVDEALRAIKTLHSEKAPLVKKRQIMRAMFGDYRCKMEEEKQKQLRLMQTATKSARVSEVSASVRRKSSKVFRPSIQNSSQDQGQCLSSSTDNQLSVATAAEPGASSQEDFIFRPSEEPFCFNFF